MIVHILVIKLLNNESEIVFFLTLILQGFQISTVYMHQNAWLGGKGLKKRKIENPSIFVTCTAFTSFMQKMARRPFWKSQSDPISNLSWFFSGNNLWTKFDKNPRIFVTCRAFTPKTGSGKAAILEVAICANIELGQAFMGMNLYTKFENYMYPRRMCDTRTIHGKVINLVN